MAISRIPDWTAPPTRGDPVQIDRRFSELEQVLRERGDVQVENAGTASDTGNGATTAFSFPHGMGAIPTGVSVVAASSAAAGAFYVSVDATNITVNYVAAPSGSLSWRWMVT